MRMRTAILATAAVVFGIWQTTALAAETGVAPAAAPDCRAAISWLLEGGLLPLQSTALPSTRSQNAITPLDYDDCRAFCEDELTSCMENCGGRPFAALSASASIATARSTATTSDRVGERSKKKRSPVPLREQSG